MLSAIKPICPRTKIRRDGTCLIFIQYCFNSERRTLLNTEISIPPNYWSRKSERISKDLPQEYGNYELLNSRIQQMIRLAEDILSLASKQEIADPLTFLKSNFKPGLNISTLIEKPEKLKQVK